MIHRIVLQNYMSHRHTVIDLAEGLTVLVGPNNCGKSAVVSALQTLCQNATGDYMLRHGERECSVRVETDDGHSVEWRRKRDGVSYALDGREVNRLNGSPPDDLHDLLRLPLVESGNRFFDVHFGEQKRPIFLLDKSPGHRATFFASSSDAVKLIEMQCLHRQDIHDARARERWLAGERAKLDRRLEKLASLEGIGDRLNQLEAEYEAITRQAGRVGSLRQTLEKLQIATQGFDRCSAQVEALRPLQRPPAILPAEALQALIRQMDSTRCRIDRSLGVVKATEPLQEPPPLAEEARRTCMLHSLLHQLSVGAEELGCWSARAAAIGPLQDPPELEPAERLGTLLAQLTVAGGQVDRCRAVNQIMKSVDDPPELNDTANLRALLDGLMVAEQGVERSRLLSGALEPFAPLPELRDPSRLAHLLVGLRSAESIVRRRQVEAVVLEELSNPPMEADDSGLVRLINDLHDATFEVTDRRGRMEQAETALAEAEHDLRHLADEIGACPTCGQTLDADLLVGAQTTEEASL